MNIIKGFAVNRSYINNNPGVVSDIGELSPIGFTYAKEPRIYSLQTYPTVSLVHFPTKGSEVGTQAPIPDNQRTHILKVIGAIYDKSLSVTAVIPPGDFLSHLQSVMGGEIADVSIGGSVVSGNRSIIEWVQWRNTAVAASNVNKVWFSNSAFEGQFDEYEITVIPPFQPVNQFFSPALDVKALLAARSYQQEMEDIQLARNNSAETVLWGSAFNYVNPLNKLDLTPAKFACLINGGAGNNSDIIRQAIVDYLLANSSYTVAEWKTVLPDLFARTEFMLFPQYDRVAIENIVGGNNAIYSPILDVAPVIEKMVADSYQYNPAHIRANAQFGAYPYMSIGVGSIGHNENREGKFKLDQWFPDYFFTNTGSPDFNRMSKKTQGWVLMITEMFRIARDLTTGSTVPNGYSRTTRGNKLFLAKSYDNVQYLVASPAVIGGQVIQ